MKQALPWLLSVMLLQGLSMGAAAQSPPLEVQMLSPPNGATLSGPTDILLAAHAADPDGPLASVEFAVNGEPLGPAEPVLTPIVTFFYLLWEDVPAGEYEITAIAIGEDGETAESEPVHIRVVALPEPVVVGVVALDPEATEPGPTTDVLDTATFSFRRSGPVDEPLDVYFSLHGEAMPGEDYVEVPTVITFSAGRSWANLVIEPLDDDLVEGDEHVVVKLEPNPAEPATGGYVLSRYQRARAVIHDNDRPSNQPPLARLLHPQHGQVFRAPTDIDLVAGAIDLDGQVIQVEFFEGENSLGVVYTPEIAPVRPVDVQDATTHFLYRLRWENVRPGHYVLTAVATDNHGDEGRSVPVEIKVVQLQPPPVVTLTAPDPEATEPEDTGHALDTATFTVHRTGDAQRPLTVLYRIAGTAENGVDYEEIPHRTEIPAGEASADIVIRPLGDNLLEGDESVILHLVHCLSIEDFPLPANACYQVGNPATARAIIHDNVPAPHNLPPRVTLVQPPDGTVFRSPATIRIAAQATDPDGEVRAVEFFANGESLGIVTDGGPPPWPELHSPDLLRPHEFFTLAWDLVSPGRYELTAVATDNDGESATSEPVRIAVIESERTIVNVFATDPIASEQSPELDAIPDTGRFTVERRGSTAEALAVFYRVGGTATNGEDYQFLPGEVLIPEGETSADILVEPIDDRLPEPTETVVIEILPPLCIAIYPPPPGCYLVGPHAVAVVHILDDDTPPSNRPPKAEITAPPQGATFAAPATVDVRVAAVDPDGWVQHVALFANGQLIDEQSIHFFTPPPPGQEQVFEFQWTDVHAGLYKVQVRVTDELGLSARSDPVAIWVREHPAIPVVNIHTIDRLAREEPTPDGPNTAAFRVRRDGGDIGQPLYVHYEIGGSAENGVDYEHLPGVVTIPAGSQSARILIVPIDDDIPEGRETVTLALFVATDEDPPPYTVGRHGRAGAIIVDHDADPPIVCRNLADGIFYFRCPAFPGDAFQVEITTNMRDWEPLETITVMEDALHYVDALSEDAGFKGYRFVPIPFDPMALED